MGYKSTVEEGVDRTIPEGTILRARLISVEYKTFSWKDAKGEVRNGENLTWKFTITEQGDWATWSIVGDTRCKMTNMRGDKFREWSEALLCRSLEIGESVDVDDLAGLPCEVLIEHQVDKKGNRWNRVGTVLPAGLSDDDIPF
jgi:hypothetical protein